MREMIWNKDKRSYGCDGCGWLFVPTDELMIDIAKAQGIITLNDTLDAVRKEMLEEFEEHSCLEYRRKT